MASDSGDVRESIRQLRAAGYSPKEIARALGLRPAVVAPLVRKLAAEQAAAAPEPQVVGCWVSPGWSQNLTVDGHPDWPDLPVGEDGPAGVACVAVARRHFERAVIDRENACIVGTVDFDDIVDAYRAFAGRSDIR